MKNVKSISMHIICMYAYCVVWYSVVYITPGHTVTSHHTLLVLITPGNLLAITVLINLWRYTFAMQQRSSDGGVLQRALPWILPNITCSTTHTNFPLPCCQLLTTAKTFKIWFKWSLLHRFQYQPTSFIAWGATIHTILLACSKCFLPSSSKRGITTLWH